MYNKVILIGNLGADPEIRTLESGAKVGKFRIATNENYQDKSGQWQKVTEWHNIVAWRRLAERVERDLRKGLLVFIEGKLTHRKYVDKEGIERYQTDINAFLIKKLERPDDYKSSAPQSDSPFETADAPSSEEKSPDDSGLSDDENSGKDSDDDLPF